MRSRQHLKFLMIAGGLATGIVATGCGSKAGTTGGTGGSAPTGAGGATTTATTSSHATSTGATMTTSTGSTGAGGAAANHSFDTATSVNIDDMPLPGTLASVKKTTKKDSVDYYKFTGKAGQRITLVVSAQSLAAPTGNGYDPTVINPVAKIYDAKHTVIAANDDAFPSRGLDSQAWTVLPADGDYYFSVEDCNSALGTNAGCAPPSGITVLDYTAAVFDASKLTAPESNAGAAQDGTTAKAVTLTYKLPAGAKAGNYGLYLPDGSFDAKVSTHVFAFTPPADTLVDKTSRGHAEFFVQPIGTVNGDGSTANVHVWVTDGNAADPTAHIADLDEADHSHGDSANQPADLSFPIKLGQAKPYYLHVKGDMTTGAVSDFYFMTHFVGSWWYGQAETKDATNGLIGTPETLTTPATAAKGAYFIDGDISSPGVGGDVDYYVMNMPKGTINATLECKAQRIGSGLRGAVFSLLDGVKADGTLLAAGTTITEAADADASTGAISFPVTTADTAVILKVEAPTQDANVTGTYYRCGTFFSAK